MNFANISKSCLVRSFISFNKAYFSTNYKSIIVSTKGHNDSIGLIQFNRPKSLNALCKELMDEASIAMNNFQKDRNIKCIILTGNEKAFAAGADIKEMSGKTYSEVFGSNFLSTWNNIVEVSKPVIAAVNGYALGGGCEVAMMCDIIYAGENAKFGQPEIKLGTIPGAGGTQRLVHCIGKSRAMELVLTGDTINAQEALAYGLISKVFPTGSLLDETIKLGDKISKLSPIAIKAAKQAILQSFNSTLTDGLLFEKQLFYGTFSTNDCKEGMAAFVEKRDAKFTNS